jgi:hypothetical protein
VPLGEVADVQIVGGPPMVRDEAGLLVGYVYVDIDQGQRDIGGYVNEAKASSRAPWPTARSSCRRLLPQVDRPVRAARADARAHEDRRAAHAAHHRAALFLQFRNSSRC